MGAVTAGLILGGLAVQSGMKAKSARKKAEAEAQKQLKKEKTLLSQEREREAQQGIREQRARETARAVAEQQRGRLANRSGTILTGPRGVPGTLLGGAV